MFFRFISFLYLIVIVSLINKVFCNTPRDDGGNKGRLPEEFFSKYKMILNKITHDANDRMDNRFKSFEPQKYRTGHTLSRNSAASYTMTSRKPRKCVQDLLRIGAIYEEVVRILKNKYSLTQDQIQYGLPKLDLRGTLLKALLDKSCASPPVCNHQHYRTMDGSCNNLIHPQWGRSMTGHIRLIPADFSDGISLPRNSSTLPNPRHISVKIHNNLNIPAVDYTAMLMQFGQLLDHDLVITPTQMISTGYEKNEMKMSDCCRTSSQIDVCSMPIEIKGNDPFYSQYNQNCMHFSRSSYYPRLGERRPINQNTAYLDGSMIYASTLNDSKKLRSSNGKLASCHGDLLPENENTEDCQAQNGKKCFLAGDPRVNEQRALTSMHTVWMREHNRIATFLFKLNPGWNDEKIYQETRRIVIAEIQHITYKEFLPILLGPEVMKKYRLNLGDSFFDQYSDSIDASIITGFSSAAFRFGHSLLTSLFSLTNHNYVNLSTIFNNPFDIYNDNSLVDKHLLGFTEQKAQTFDVNIVHEVTRLLFVKPGQPFGLDLAALNIQRGRDHGVPPYTKWLKYCLNINAKTFEEIPIHIIGRVNLNRLKEIFSNVEEVDLFTAGLAENHIRGGLVGPTFACIIGLQFKNLRMGDRFWYENSGPTRFTFAQLKEIKNITLGRIICDNIKGHSSLQENVMLSPNSRNPKVSCFNRPSINLNLWREVYHG